MGEHEAAKTVAESSSVWNGLGVFLGAAGAYLGKHMWDKTRRPKSSSHSDFLELKQMLSDMKEEMAVMRATVATKEDLAESMEKSGDKMRALLDSVHNRISDHLRDHSKAA